MNEIPKEIRQKVIELLHAEECSCVVYNRNQTRIFREKGVKDLYRMLSEEPEFLDGAFIADKTVGKAAAALMITGGIKGLYANVISEPALALLKLYGINTDAMQIVAYIRNRVNTDLCPLEKLCLNENSVEKIVPLITAFIKRVQCKTGA